MINFEKVSRKKSKARIAVTGPSGAGKTVSALLLAYGITGDWSKVALIDTEHERGRFYANRSDLNIGEFMYAPMAAPYTPEKYKEYVASATGLVGSDGVVIVDSFSHVWDNEGGVLEIKEQIEQGTNMNSFTAWNKAGRIQNDLVNTILSTDCHTIVTMRSKMAYAMEVNERGKTVPVKLGLAPVQRENTEYEFDMCFTINREHIASLSKDTTFLDSWSGIVTSDLGKQLGDWLSEGEEPPRCSDCGKVIFSTKCKTVGDIVKGSTKLYGRPLCTDCIRAEVKKAKEAENAAPPVSN